MTKHGPSKRGKTHRLREKRKGSKKKRVAPYRSVLPQKKNPALRGEGNAYRI